jgi:hypothetical protein
LVRRASTGTSIRCGFLWLGLGLQACGDLPGRSFSNVCPASDVGLCDVRDRACQEQVGRYIACLAERDFKQIPEVVTSTLSRPRERYAPWLGPLRPAVLALGLLDTSTTTEPVERWDYARGVIERAELRAYDDREAVTGLGFAMALALYDQTEGWTDELTRRSDFDGAVALRSVWTGVALLWADHLDAALAGISYFELGPRVPTTRPGPGLERNARNFEHRFGAAVLSHRWLRSVAAVERWVEAPPESVLALSYGDALIPGPVPVQLILPRPTLAVLSQGALGPVAWPLRGYLIALGSDPLIGDRVFAIEDTTTGLRGGLWVLRARREGAVAVAHPDPLVREELRAAGQALLGQ